MLGFADRISALLVARKALAETEKLWSGVLTYVKRHKGADTAQVTCLRNLALVRLAAGNVEGYGKMCAELEKLSPACVAETAWARSLDARKPDDALLMQARKQLDAAKPPERSVLGALLCRAGQAQEALAYLPTSAKGSAAWDDVFAALAHRQLGDEAQARSCRDRAAARLPAAPWAERLACQLVLREFDDKE
jgi:hypothetical protein